jgi:hypothetical protein
MKTSIYFQNPLKVLILKGKMVGLGGLEPPTSPLSVVSSYPKTILNKGYMA